MTSRLKHFKTILRLERPNIGPRGYCQRQSRPRFDRNVIALNPTGTVNPNLDPNLTEILWFKLKWAQDWNTLKLEGPISGPCVNPNLDPDLMGKLHKIRLYVQLSHQIWLTTCRLDLRRKPEHCTMLDTELRVQRGAFKSQSQTTDI